MLKVVVGSLIIAASIIIAAAFGRYEISVDDGQIYRADRLTGRVEVCAVFRPPTTTNPEVMQPPWCEAARQRARLERRPH